MTTQSNPTTGIRKVTTKSPITVDKLYSAEYQKEGTLTAQLRQAITTESFYPAKQVSSNLHDNLFGNEDFGFGEKEFTNVENRVTWMDVPVNTTLEEVQKRVNMAYEKGASLYRIISNHPILTDHQAYAVTSGQRTEDDFANTQIVRYPEQHEQAGAITLDSNGKAQYRRVFFSLSGEADQDLRTPEMEDQYQSPEIAAELQGASVISSNQTI